MPGGIGRLDQDCRLAIPQQRLDLLETADQAAGAARQSEQIKAAACQQAFQGVGQVRVDGDRSPGGTGKLALCPGVFHRAPRGRQPDTAARQLTAEIRY